MVVTQVSTSAAAAGCEGSGFTALVWSADGGTLAGLSDRLCVWRFRPNAPGGQLLERSRVVRVFDTSSPRNRLFVSPKGRAPTFVTLETQSGTCFVFDPIEAVLMSLPTQQQQQPVLADVTLALANKGRK